MYDRLSKEAISVLLINDFKEIMKLFFGPFLIAFFIQKSPNSTPLLSIYYFLAYFFSSIFWLISGKYANNKNKVKLFRIGIVIECIYALMFVFLKEKVINHVILMAFIYGASCASFFLPYNFLIGDKIKKENREDFELLKEASISLIKLFVPILLGFAITITNYHISTIIIVILTIIQFILTFNVKGIKENKNDSFNPLAWFKEVLKNKDMKYIFWGEYLKGLTINNGALTIIITIYVINTFKTDIALGYITSFSYAVSLIFAYFYNKYFKESDNDVILLCSIVPTFLTVLIVLRPTSYLVLLYNLLYYSFITILFVCANSRVWNKAESKEIRKTDRVEYWVVREIFLNFGRMTSYLILFFVSVFASKLILNIYVITLAFSLLLIGYTTRKITK